MTMCLMYYKILLSIVPILFHYITLSHYTTITCTFFFSKIRQCTHSCSYRNGKLRPLEMLSRESLAHTCQNETLANYEPLLSSCTTCTSAREHPQVPGDPGLCMVSFVRPPGVLIVPQLTQLLPGLGFVLPTFCSAEVHSQACQAARHLICLFIFSMHVCIKGMGCILGCNLLFCFSHRL